MPVIYAEVEEKVMALLRKHSGKEQVSLEHMVNADLGLEGWESIDLLEDIEDTFELDLDPLMRSATWYLPPKWWDRLLGKTRGARVTDLPVKDLIAYVIEHAGEGKNGSIPRIS